MTRAALELALHSLRTERCPMFLFLQPLQLPHQLDGHGASYIDNRKVEFHLSCVYKNSPPQQKDLPTITNSSQTAHCIRAILEERIWNFRPPSIDED
ncbi:hypothetical protein AVEN_194411-1 [Araneus ventricosus]|uniref:Uncharacterized protein n=1 Tax=Araneus ventricosus TaxID=182803 RepID=A0A4Y2A5L9_ARAVE|nr:hypothetical protein AVEN_194411-1 [Araneus ventricosus]